MDEDVRRELDLLHQADRDLRQAITDLDNHGSRGVLQLTGQMTDMVKDFAELKLAFNTHEQQHVEEKRERVRNRRWIVGTVLASLGGFATVIGLLVDLVRHVHLAAAADPVARQDHDVVVMVGEQG